MIDIAWLRECLDRSARFVKVVALDAQHQRRKRVLPPEWVAKTLAARGQWPFPALEGVVETPTLRPDGSILETAGYDNETGLVFDPGSSDFPTFPANPSLATARKALCVLAEPFDDFPFLANSDRSTALAAVLTVLARPAIVGPCPMFAIRAPSPGTGKSLLADAIATIATGRPGARLAPPRDDDEARKLILALGLDGTSIATIDNASGAFGSQSIAAALTATAWTDRLLGVSRVATVQLRTVWLLTGNNTTFRGDLGRRVLPCDLDAECEHPEDRTGFKHPKLSAYLSSHRKKLVIAALTILRAYHLAGRPPHQSPPKGSFEAWDSFIRGALIWTGATDPLQGRERLRADADADLDALRQGLSAWECAFGNEPTTAAEAVVRAKQDGEMDLATGLAALIGCTTAQLDSRRLGYTLRRVKGRRVQRRRFEPGRPARNGVRRWVVVCEPKADSKV
jgi:hypothetical protein